MNKIIIILLINVFVFSTVEGQNRDQLTLDNFNLEETKFPNRDASFFKMALQNSKEEIELHFLAKPDKIVASFFDETYLLVVYQSGYTHYLTGVYKNEKKWEQDYFHRMLDFSSGIFSEKVKSAKFLDGETLFISYEGNRSGERKPTFRNAVFRICKDRIYEYAPKEVQEGVGFTGDNPIRPID